MPRAGLPPPSDPRAPSSSPPSGPTVEFVEQHRGAIRAIAGGLIIGISVGDHFVQGISLGVLYIIPVMMIATSAPRAVILALALGTTLLREAWGPSAWAIEAPARLSIAFGVTSIAGLFVAELTRSARLTLENLRQAKAQKRLREQAEEESRQLVESSPGAILLISAGGRIERDNHSAREMLAAGESLIGQNVLKFLPALVSFLETARKASMVRTIVECGGRRANGDGFYAQMWISSFTSPEGPRLAVIFSDATEVLRDREELGLRQLLMSSRIVAAAVSHEVKNLSAAAHRIHRDLGRQAGISAREDYKTLGMLLDNMRKLASEDLGPAVDELKTGADLNAVLQELFLILEPMFREDSIRFSSDIQPGLPRVRADHAGLLQVFLNLAQNFQRALQDVPEKRITLQAYGMDRFVIVRFGNNGPVLEDPERLFHPLQPKASATGLGMFISRAILRTYGGELQHIPQPEGCSFLIQMPAADGAQTTHV